MLILRYGRMKRLLSGDRKKKTRSTRQRMRVNVGENTLSVLKEWKSNNDKEEGEGGG